MLSLLGAVCLFLSVLLYRAWLSRYETRTLLAWSIGMLSFGNFMMLLFALRVNVKLGIPNIVWVLFTTTVIDIFMLAFKQLPTYVLFAKLTPAVIEGTVFSVITSVTNIITPMSKTFGL